MRWVLCAELLFVGYCLSSLSVVLCNRKSRISLDDLPYEEGDDLSPQSLQPVIFTNGDGERQIEQMRWAFNPVIT
jgi:hypothetical protein